MPQFELRPGDEHPLASAIRKAIGVGPYDQVDIQTPQFEREDGKTFTFRPDKSVAFFDRLREAPADILEDVGMRRWDERLMLFPHEWYDHIPEGYEVVDINGDAEPFHHGVTDDDIRYGCLAYGFLKPEQRKELTPP